nr:protein kinase byr2-like [Ipomoea trifida]
MASINGYYYIRRLNPTGITLRCTVLRSYGTVFLGRLSSSSSTDPQVFAVKSSKLESSRSLRVEGRILNQLRGCPYIVHCFGDDTSLEHEEVVYNLLLEYAPGGSLESLIKSRPGNIMEFEVSFYAYQLLKGIEEVHCWRLVHCDLKPANVLVFPCGCGVNRLKIADFGLAKPSGVNIFGGCHRGSLLYTSPESLVSKMHEAPKDIWAIGCIVVEMITGNPPDAFLNIAFKKPEIPEGISNSCKDFLEMCFARNPSTRWTAPMLLNHPFVANEFNLRCADCLGGGEEGADDCVSSGILVEFEGKGFLRVFLKLMMKMTSNGNGRKNIILNTSLQVWREGILRSFSGVDDEDDKFGEKEFLRVFLKLMMKMSNGNGKKVVMRINDEDEIGVANYGVKKIKDDEIGVEEVAYIDQIGVIKGMLEDLNRCVSACYGVVEEVDHVCLGGHELWKLNVPKAGEWVD